MQKLSKEDRKAYNEHVDNRNHDLRQSSTIFALLTIGLFIGAIAAPAELSFYLIIGAAFCGLMRIITSKMAG